ncbi:MAG TPA: hypothetical protein VE777_18115 [Gaiellales bacterium]|nr:hypothetical protein [Gaiellales bacterium]
MPPVQKLERLLVVACGDASQQLLIGPPSLSLAIAARPSRFDHDPRRHCKRFDAAAADPMHAA